MFSFALRDCVLDIRSGSDQVALWPAVLWSHGMDVCLSNIYCRAFQPVYYGQVRILAQVHTRLFAHRTFWVALGTQWIPSSMTLYLSLMLSAFLESASGDLPKGEEGFAGSTVTSEARAGTDVGVVCNSSLGCV